MANIMTSKMFLEKMAKVFTKYGVLTSDMIWQEELFNFQDEMMELLVEFYNKNETIPDKTMEMFEVFTAKK